MAAPHRNRVEVFEREADRIHQPVTLHAIGAHAMLQHLLAHRLVPGVAARDPPARLERWNIRRRIRRTHAENVRHDPLASRDRRRSLRLGRRRQEGALAEQPAPHVHLGAERHAPELAAVDVRDAVVSGQPFVDERVVRRQQIDHAAVFTNDAVEEQLHFTPHGLAQRVVEVGIQHRQRAGALQAAQVEPLPGKVDGQRLRSRIAQHAARLLLEHLRILQPSLAGELDQLVIGTGAPQEKRQARRQIEVADAIGLPGFRFAGSSSMR